jgi:hypothetical protein
VAATEERKGAVGEMKHLKENTLVHRVILIGEWEPPYKTGDIITVDAVTAETLFDMGWAGRVIVLRAFTDRECPGPICDGASLGDQMTAAQLGMTPHEFMIQSSKAGNPNAW